MKKLFQVWQLYIYDHKDASPDFEGVYYADDIQKIKDYLINKYGWLKRRFDSERLTEEFLIHEMKVTEL